MKKNIWIPSVVASVCVLSLLGLSVMAQTTETTPAAELFYQGASRGSYPTVTEAFAEATSGGGEVVLLRDVDEDIVIGEEYSYSYNQTYSFQLNGKRLRGSLTIYHTDLDFSSPEEGVTNRIEAGDLRSIVLHKDNDWNKIRIQNRNKFDLSQTDLSNCLVPIQAPGADAEIRVPQGFERNLLDFNGQIYVVVGDKRLNFGYEPFPTPNKDLIHLVKQDGTSLTTDANGVYTVPNVKIWRGPSGNGGISDLSSLVGWESGALPGANDLVLAYLQGGTERINFGSAPFEVAGLYLVMKDQNISREGTPVLLNGTCKIGGGTGLLISDMNLVVDPGQVLCGSLEVGHQYAVTFGGEQIVSANLSGLGGVNIGKNANVELTGNNSHSGGHIADGACVKAKSLSKLGTSMVTFGTRSYGYEDTPASIEIVLAGDTDDSALVLPRIETDNVIGKIRFSGSGIYTIPQIAFNCSVVNDLAGGFRLAEPGHYRFVDYSGNGGFRLDQVDKVGVRSVLFNVGDSWPTDNLVFLRSGVSVTEGARFQPILVADSMSGPSDKPIRFSSVCSGPGYESMIVHGGIELAKGSQWGGNLILLGESDWDSPLIRGSGTITGNLIVPGGFNLSQSTGGDMTTIQGNIVAENGGKINVAIPRNSEEGDVLMRFGGIDSPSSPMDIFAESQFGLNCECGFDDPQNPRAIEIKVMPPVAKLNGVEYKSLAKAYAAAATSGQSESEILMINNTFEDVTNTTPISIELNGYTIFGSMTAYADLTLNNRDVQGVGEIEGVERDTLTVGCPGILNQDIHVKVNVQLGGRGREEPVDGGIAESDIFSKPSTLRLYGGTTTYTHPMIFYDGQGAVIKSMEGGNANLIFRGQDVGMIKGWSFITWAGRGTLDLLGGQLVESPITVGIEAYAGTLNLKHGTICPNAYWGGDVPGGDLLPHKGAAVAVLQKDSRSPVTLNVSGDMQLGVTVWGDLGKYSIYEDSVTSLSSDPLISMNVWPKLNVKGGTFGGTIHSTSLEKGMPPFVTGGTFLKLLQDGRPFNLEDFLPEGYTATPAEEMDAGYTSQMVYPKPAGDGIVPPQGCAPLSGLQTALIMSGIGLPPEGTTSTELRLPNNDLSILTNCQYWGIGPKMEMEGTVQVASYAIPKLQITGFDFQGEDIIVEGRLLPQDGTTLQKVFPEDAIRVNATEDLKVPMEDNGGTLTADGYFDPENPGRFKVKFWDYRNPKFFQMILRDPKPEQ